MKYTKTSFRRKYAGTFFFFPALLPLAELVPWLLTLLGAVAAAAGFSFPAFWRKYNKAIISFSAFCILMGALVYYAHLASKEVRKNGTMPVIVTEHPTTIPAVVPAANTAEPIQRAATLSKEWFVKTPQQILSTPVIVDDVLLYGTYKGSIEAVSLSDGSPLWALPANGPVFTMTKGENGIVYNGEGLHDTKEATLTAFQGHSGIVLWQRKFLGHMEESFTLDPQHNRMWVSTGPNGLWALNMTNSDILWHSAIGHIDARALLHNNAVFVAADIDEANHKTLFYALDAASGETLWTLPLPGQPWGSPLLEKTGRIILTTTGKGQIGALKGTDAGWAQGISPDGNLLWQAELPGMTVQPSSYSAANDTIIHTTKNGYICALNARDGSKLWEVPAGNEFQSSATLIETKDAAFIAATSYEGTLIILDAATGRELYREEKAATHSTSSPAYQDDRLYVAGARIINAYTGLATLAGEKQ